MSLRLEEREREREERAEPSWREVGGRIGL